MRLFITIFLNSLTGIFHNHTTKTSESEYEFGESKNNRAVISHASRSALAGGIDQATNSIIKMFSANANRTWDKHKYTKDFLTNLIKKWKPNNAQLPQTEIINEKTLLTHTEFIEIKKQKPVSFFENLLLHYEWNFLYGKQKIGKSRGLLDIIAKAFKNSDKKCAIISSDNDKNIMLSPLFDLMGIKKYFVWIDPKINTYFNPQDLPIVEKIEIYLKRIKEYLTNNPDTICLFIDPLPRFLDWNKEHLVSMFISGMREIARELNRCIIGVRNEGKNRSYDTSDAYKGNSAIGDDSRQVIRSIKCHRRSALGKLAKTKEGKPQKSFVIYTELSSLYGEVGYLFKLEINPDTKIAVPILIKKIEKNVDTIKYLCTPESGKSLANKIFHFIQKGPEKGCTLEDLYDEFEDEHNQDAIKKAVYRNFDHKTISGVTYIQIKKDSQNLTKTHPSP